MFSWKRGCLDNSKLKMAFTSIRRRKAEFLTETERNEMQEYERRISFFEGYMPEKTSVYILKPCQKLGQSFEVKKVYKEVNLLRT